MAQEVVDCIDAFLEKIYATTFLKPDLSSTSTASKPFVTLTYAQSLDAKIAGKNGQQLILSGKESMAMTHRLRAVHNAILVGIGTVLNDDPQLNCRIPTLLPVRQQPQPFVLDSRARTPPTCKLIKNAQNGIGKYPVIVCLADEYLDEEAQARVGVLLDLQCRIMAIEGKDRIDPARFLARLNPGTRLMVEGGSAVIASFLHASPPVVDRLVVTVAPTLVGEAGVPVTPTEQQGERVIVRPPALRHIASQHFGIDTVFAASIEP